MKQAISAYHSVVVSPEFKEYVRLRTKARHDEAQALRSAERRGEVRGEQAEREKWQAVVSDKDAEIERLRAQLKKQNGNAE